jgi:hypothetical protein
MEPVEKERKLRSGQDEGQRLAAWSDIITVIPLDSGPVATRTLLLLLLCDCQQPPGTGNCVSYTLSFAS